MPCVRSYGERSQTLQDPRTRDLTGPLIGLILVSPGTGLPLKAALTGFGRKAHLLAFPIWRVRSIDILS